MSQKLRKSTAIFRRVRERGNSSDNRIRDKTASVTLFMLLAIVYEDLRKKH